MALSPGTETEETGKWKERRKVYSDDSVSPSRVIDAVVVVGNDGSLNPGIEEYSISEKDNDASPHYYGFERADGGWYIMKETVSPGADTFRYLKGSSDLATTWANRTLEIYDTFANTF